MCVCVCVCVHVYAFECACGCRCNVHVCLHLCVYCYFNYVEYEDMSLLKLVKVECLLNAIKDM